MMDKIVCVGKNYGAHAAEMKEPIPEQPVIFLKPPSVINQSASEVRAQHPWDRGAVHYECEIVLKLSPAVARVSPFISPEDLWTYVEGVTLGLDMTLRDIQTGLKKGGLPWTTGKVFKDSAILGPWLNVEAAKKLWAEPFTFTLNGEVKQTGRVGDMLRDPATLIAAAAGLFPLCPGDIFFTGTPAGVGEVKRGDEGRLRWGAWGFGVKWG